MSPPAGYVHAALIDKYSAPVPRYTSYPTAPHFSPGIGHAQYALWLAKLPAAARLSLYIHIPFCHQLCWYCGCNTKATQRYAPIAQYLRLMRSEMTHVARLVPRDHVVAHIHWGGGSPNILEAADIVALAAAIRAQFHVQATAEFAVEIDPRHMDTTKADAFSQAGVTRVSVGVQDFDPVVQAAIGREQSFDVTRTAVAALRERGIASINIDLMYGLPRQTAQSVERTIAQVVELDPDRIAIFGYAHLPDRMKHQRLIPGQELPDAHARFTQATALAHYLAQRGYVKIGLDHFARPTDALATGPIGRNFQGYTTDQSDALLGIGASAIGYLPQGYVQNAVAAADYMQRVRHCGLATARGILLSTDDRVRSHVIERLMCSFEFSAPDVESRFGVAAGPILAAAADLVATDQDGLVTRTAEGFIVTERGRPFIRSICARFDAYSGNAGARHSAGV